jgi:methylphosphotriester-DNA--protein-cysteine methyltransferase
MNKHIGSKLETLFDELGERDQFEARTMKKVVALQLRARMQATNVTKSGLAHAMKTSRSAVDRLLDPANPSMTFETLARAARAMRAEVIVRVVPKGAARKVGVPHTVAVMAKAAGRR